MWGRSGVDFGYDPPLFATTLRPHVPEASDPAELLATRLAGAGRGALALRDADALADAREALRAIAGAMGGADGGSGGATLAVILGTPSGLARLARTQRGFCGVVSGDAMCRAAPQPLGKVRAQVPRVQ